MAYPRNKERLEKFADWLKKQMIRAGFESQRQFAIAANISPTSISRIVQAKQLPDEETIKKMASALNCQFWEVMSQAGYGGYMERRSMENTCQTPLAPTLEQTNEISVNSIDISKMIALIQTVINAINWNKKFRLVLKHNPEEKKSIIQIYK